MVLEYMRDMVLSLQNLGYGTGDAAAQKVFTAAQDGIDQFVLARDIDDIRAKIAELRADIMEIQHEMDMRSPDAGLSVEDRVAALEERLTQITNKNYGRF